MPLKAFGDLFAHRHGEGVPRVLALHGWGRSGSDFDAVLHGIPSLAVDLPGFGATAPPPHPVGAAWYAEALAPVLEAFEAPPVLLGHSFGGRVAVCLAAVRPVAGLVLTGAPLLRSRSGARPSLGYRMIRAGHRFGFVSDERMERIRRSRGSADYRAATGVMRDILVTVVNESYESQLERLEVPVRLVWGADDSEVPVSVAEAVLSHLGDRGPATLEVVEGHGHHLPLTGPERLRSVVESLL